MNLNLTRVEFSPNGIFGELSDESGGQVAATLEHSYDSQPKIPAGTYTCVRGQHQLAHMLHPFETFEVTNVPGHTNILIHTGNYNDDSEGCILVGMSRQGDAITASRATFEKFMALQAGVDTFTLTVTDP